MLQRQTKSSFHAGFRGGAPNSVHVQLNGTERVKSKSQGPIVILYVQEVVTILYSKLLYKIGHYFLDIKY